jgi:mannose-6-phosphate isomerase-like protein (cupin superfamily)
VTAPRFVGAHGDDWCVRPAVYGPADRAHESVMSWLIVPGPPLSCYASYVPPLLDPTSHSFFHAHPSTWSIHVVLEGRGKHFIEGKGHDVGPGSVIYQGPGVRHALFPDPGHHLLHLSIQHPAAGHTDKEWVICPEAGTPERFGDLAAFRERFGSIEQVMNGLVPMFVGDRWKEYVARRR